jgi:hypothetical protein
MVVVDGLQVVKGRLSMGHRSSMAVRDSQIRIVISMISKVIQTHRMWIAKVVAICGLATIQAGATHTIISIALMSMGDLQVALDLRIVGGLVAAGRDGFGLTASTLA